MEKKKETQQKNWTELPEEMTKKVVETSQLRILPYKDPKTGKWKGYKARKGVTPPWDPFNPERKRGRLTINERKFLYVLGKTGNLSEAYKSSYKVKDYGDPVLQKARVNAMANQVLARLRRKEPELTKSTTLEDITVDFVKQELLKNYQNPEATIGEKTRLLELMGRHKIMFSDKHVVESKVQEVAEQVFTESDDDFPEIDERKHRLEIDDEVGRA